MQLLVERSKKAGYPRLHAFNTFFYTKLLAGGYAGVRRWTRGTDLFKQDIILVPVHLRMHWALVVSQTGLLCLFVWLVVFVTPELEGENKTSKKSHFGLGACAAAGCALSKGLLFLTGHRRQKENHHVL